MLQKYIRQDDQVSVTRLLNRKMKVGSSYSMPLDRVVWEGKLIRGCRIL